MSNVGIQSVSPPHGTYTDSQLKCESAIRGDCVREDHGRAQL